MKQCTVYHVPSGIKFFFVVKDAVESHRSSFQLEARYANCAAISGTRNQHSFVPKSLTNLKMKRVSVNEFLSSVSVSLLHVSPNLSVFVPGIRIVCVYDDNWFLGNILEICKENQEIQVQFMKLSVSSDPFTWPQEEDICWIPVTHILCKVISLKVKSAAGRCNQISSTEHREILNLFVDFMKMSGL